VSAAPRPLGVFAVTASRADVEAFRTATGSRIGGDALPLTFPMRWLVNPDIRAAMATLVPEADLVLVHESQSFDYAVPLRIGAAYALTLQGRRKSDPDQLIVDGTIASRDGSTVATLETILRLFSTTQAAA
jgi:hypothetical protein